VVSLWQLNLCLNEKCYMLKQGTILAYAKYAWLKNDEHTVYCVLLSSLKSLYCIHFGRPQKGFSIVTPQNLDRFGWNMEYKCGTTVCTRVKKLRGKSPPGVPPNGAKTCFVCFSVRDTTRRFGHFFLHWLRLFLKQQPWIGVPEHTPWKIFEFLCRSFASPKKLSPEVVIWVGSLLSAYSINDAVLGNRNHFKG